LEKTVKLNDERIAVTNILSVDCFLVWTFCYCAVTLVRSNTDCSLFWWRATERHILLAAIHAWHLAWLPICLCSAYFKEYGNKARKEWRETTLR